MVEERINLDKDPDFDYHFLDAFTNQIKYFTDKNQQDKARKMTEKLYRLGLIDYVSKALSEVFIEVTEMTEEEIIENFYDDKEE